MRIGGNMTFDTALEDVKALDNYYNDSISRLAEIRGLIKEIISISSGITFPLLIAERHYQEVFFSSRHNIDSESADYSYSFFLSSDGTFFEQVDCTETEEYSDGRIINYNINTQKHDCDLKYIALLLDYEADLSYQDSQVNKRTNNIADFGWMLNDSYSRYTHNRIKKIYPESGTGLYLWLKEIEEGINNHKFTEEINISKINYSNNAINMPVSSNPVKKQDNSLSAKTTDFLLSKYNNIFYDICNSYSFMYNYKKAYESSLSESLKCDYYKRIKSVNNELRGNWRMLIRIAHELAVRKLSENERKELIRKYEVVAVDAQAFSNFFASANDDGPIIAVEDNPFCLDGNKKSTISDFKASSTDGLVYKERSEHDSRELLSLKERLELYRKARFTPMVFLVYLLIWGLTTALLCWMLIKTDGFLMVNFPLLWLVLFFGLPTLLCKFLGKEWDSFYKNKILGIEEEIEAIKLQREKERINVEKKKVCPFDHNQLMNIENELNKAHERMLDRNYKSRYPLPAGFSTSNVVSPHCIIANILIKDPYDSENYFYNTFPSTEMCLEVSAQYRLSIEAYLRYGANLSNEVLDYLERSYKLDLDSAIKYYKKYK